MKKETILRKSVLALLILLSLNVKNLTAQNTFVIDASGKGNFTTFAAAIASLSTGITVPTIFIVKAGTYTGRVVVPVITGASAINTVSFVGVSRDSVTITFAGTTAANRATVVLNGADYITFRNIRIANTGATYATSLLFTAQADYNTIDNCDLRIDSVSTSVTANTFCNVLATNSEAVDAGYGNNANYNVIQNCRINGGNYGVRFNGTSATVTCSNNFVLRNSLHSQYTNCIYYYYQNGARIENNYLYNVRNVAAYGISSWSSLNSRIIGNNVHAGQYGIYLDTEKNTTTTTSVVNNMVSDLTNTAQYGIYMKNVCTGVDVLHNSVIVSGSAASTTNAAICVVDGSTIRVLNNNLMSFGAYPCLNVLAAAVLTTGCINYNVMYNSTGGSIAYWKTAQFADINDLKNIDLSVNQNSVQASSEFISNTDLHLLTTATGRYAQAISTVTTDIDGNSRCSVSATIGADEISHYPTARPTVSFTSADSFSLYTAVTFTNIATADEPKRNSWYINGVFESNDLNMVKVFKSDSAYQIKLVTENCFSLDSFKKTIKGRTPTVASNTFIIDAAGTGSFLTFTAAIASLSTGITAPTLFIVKPGTYNERITLTPVTGASATNTITFVGMNKNNCILTFAGTSTSNRATIVMNGADYFRFRNLKVLSNGATYGMSVLLTAQADYNIFEDCILWVLPSATSDNVVNVVFNGAESSVASYANNANYNLVQNCRIVGGNYGIRFNGTSNTVACMNNFFLNNDLDNQYTNGIYYYYQSGARIENNYIHNVKSLTSYGVYAYNSCNSRILRNNIHSRQYGIYLASENRYITGSSVVANNMVSDLTNSTHYGIYMTALNTAVDILHNSVIVSGSAVSTVCAAISVVDGSGNRILNNYLMSFGYFPCLNIAAAASFSVGTIDYNGLYNSTGGTIAYWITTDYTKLVSLKRINLNLNQNSYQANPVFVSNTNLHLGTTAVGRFGKPISGITTDMDGDARCTSYATIGADEYNRPCNSSAVDVSAGSILSALIVGNNNLTISFSSTKIDTIRRLSFGYQVDNNTAVNETNKTLTTPLAIFNTGSYTFTTPLNFPTKGNYNLKFWVNMPNGSADNDISNDTIIIPVYIADTFNIDQSGKGDFLTFNTAITTVLKTTTGIFGPIVFRVKTGVYNERISLSEVLGASAINTITFIGISKDSVNLTFTGTATTNRATVVLNGGDFYRFKKLKVTSNGTFGMTFFFTGQADNNIIDGCDLNVITTGTTADVTNVLSANVESSVTGYANNANNNLIQNCFLKGGYYGIVFTGTSTTVNCNNNVFLNNDLSYQYAYGIYDYYQTNARIEGNSIHEMMYTSSYGISLWSSNNSKVLANKVNAHRNGIDINSENRYVTGSTLIANNMICELSNMYQYGINLTAVSTGVDVFHNSVIETGGPAATGSMSISGSVITFIMSTGASIWINDGTNNRVFNNNLLQLGAFPSIDYEAAAVVNAGDIDYNVMYNLSGGPLVNWKGSNFINLPQLKLFYPLFNQNSIQANPGYVSTTNLHLLTTATGKFGKQLPSVTTDLDRDPRCMIAPTIGADEYIHSSTVPVAGFTSVDTIAMNSPYTFLNIAYPGEPKKHTWYVNGTFINNNLNLTRTFTTSGFVRISLVTQNCFASDSISKMVFVDSPKVAPIAEFVTSKYVVNVNDSLMLTDLSVNYPNSWKWQISPDSIMDTTLGMKMSTFNVRNGGLNTQNPLLQFLTPGKYTVSLQSSNSKGSSPVTTKIDYIEVVNPNVLCSWPVFSEANSGTLYDGGGAIGNYVKNTNCNYLINPCAGSIILKFNDVDIKSVDYLRIYDGKDNTGTPLWSISVFGNYGINNITWGDPKFQTTYTAHSGSMYIEFVTDPRTVGNPLGRGFSAEWTSTPGSFSKPNASFVSADSVCLGRSLKFTNTSTGDRLTYEWDFDNDSLIDDVAKNPVFDYQFAGTYNAMLIAKTCGGTDTFIKRIVAYNPVTNPVLEFSADNLTPAKGSDIVTLSDKSAGCTDNWEWQISPNTFTVAKNTILSPEVGLIFNDTGCYDVTMISGYGSGSDTITKKCYIRPVGICNPVVGSIDPDVAINRVVIGSIDNSSSVSSSGYTDYTSNYSTMVQKGEKATITVYRITTKNTMNRKVWVDWNIDGDFNDPGEMVGSEPSSITNSWSVTFNIPKNAKAGYSRIRVGVSLSNQTNNPCGVNNIGEFEDYRILIHNDEIKPLISLKGNPVVMIEQCKNYIDSSATAMDNVDGNISPMIKVTGTVNTAVAGTYVLSYNVTDSSGNKAIEVSRTVKVTVDATNPVLTLNGKLIETIPLCTSWIDPGYFAIDSCTGLDTFIINGVVNTLIPGPYLINYTAYDQAGNSTMLSRTVIVSPDIIPPSLVLNGNSVYQIQVYSSWTDPGYVVSDTCTGLDKVIVSGNADTSLVGTYIITYTASDKAGNQTTVSRTVKVVDTIAPVVSSLSTDTIIADVYYPLIQPVLKTTDNYYKTFNTTVSGSYFANFPDGVAKILGYYSLGYLVTDGSGNSDSIYFTVKVVDRVLPEIVLVGSPLVQIYRYSVLTPSQDSVQVSDNYDPSPVVLKSGTYLSDYLINRSLGVYELAYCATDQSGNKRCVYRYVNVVTGTSGVADNGSGFKVNVFPNPNHGSFAVEFSQPLNEMVKIYIVNNVGKTILVTNLDRKGQNIIELNLGNVAEGIYFMQIIQGKQKITQRLSIIR